MTKAVFIEETGPAQVLKFGEVTTPVVQPGTVLVEVVYSTVNFIDTYFRSGLYKAPQFPYQIGRDGSGFVKAVGEGVTRFKVGDRVCFLAEGSNATEILVKDKHITKVPEGVSLAQAACSMIQGLTAAALTNGVSQLNKDKTILVLAGAGGTGSLIIQMAKAFGATVIATVSTEEKKKIVESLGADHIIVGYTDDGDFSTKIRDLTNGRGVDVVFDGVGKTTYQSSLKSVCRRGLVVFFGNASGPVPPIDPLELTKAGSIFLTRPTVSDYIQSVEEFENYIQQIFSWIQSNQLRLNIAKVFTINASEDIQDAHKYLESRAATGKILLLLDESKKDL